MWVGKFIGLTREGSGDLFGGLGGEGWEGVGVSRSFIYKNRTSETIGKTHGKLSKPHLKMAHASCGSNIITLEQHLYTYITLGIDII